MLTAEQRAMQEEYARQELERKMQRGLALMLEEVKARGIVEDDNTALDEKPECEDCYHVEAKKSLGRVKLNVPFGHPQWGKWVECPNLLCPVARRIHFERTEKLMSVYGYMPKEYAPFSFPLWDETIVGYLADGKHLARIAAEAFAWHVVNTGREWSISEAFEKLPHIHNIKELEPDYSAPPLADGRDNPKWFKRIQFSYTLDGITKTETLRDSVAKGLVLASPTRGRGKTGLAVAAARYLAEHGVSTSLIHVPTLISRLQATIDKDYVGQSKQDILATLHADVLILDEFGSTDRGKASNYVTGIIETEIITPLFNDNKPFIVTTNLSASELKDYYGETTASRVFKMAHWLTLSGANLRRENLPIPS